MSSTKPGDQLSSSSRQDVSEPRIDLSKPRYDQSTYGGRVRHFFETTNPANALVTRKQLEEAANLVKAYKYVFSETILVHEHTHTHSFSLPLHPLPPSHPSYHTEMEKLLLVQQQSSFGRQSFFTIQRITRTLGRKCSFWVGCLARFLPIWSSLDAYSHSAGTRDVLA